MEQRFGNVKNICSLIYSYGVNQIQGEIVDTTWVSFFYALLFCTTMN